MWGDHQYCAICLQNDMCSLHHIDGCKKKMHRSILNSIMLCYKHHKEADGYNTSSPKGEEVRRRLRKMSLKRFQNEGMLMNDYDKEYHSHYHADARE